MVKFLSLSLSPSLTIYNDAHFDFSLVVSRLDTKPRRERKKKKVQHETEERKEDA